MSEATIALTAMTGLLLLSFLGFLVWGVRSGQFRDIEDAKYRMLGDSRKAGTARPRNGESNAEAGDDR